MSYSDRLGRRSRRGVRERMAYDAGLRKKFARRAPATGVPCAPGSTCMVDGSSYAAYSAGIENIGRGTHLAGYYRSPGYGAQRLTNVRSRVKRGDTKYGLKNVWIATKRYKQAESKLRAANARSTRGGTSWTI